MNYSDTVYVLYQYQTRIEPKVCRTFESMLFVPDVFWANPKYPGAPHLCLCTSRRGGIHVIGLLEYQGLAGALSDVEVHGWYIDPVKLPWSWWSPLEASESLSKAFHLEQVYLRGYETRVGFSGAYSALMGRMEQEAYKYLKNCTFA